MYRVALAIDVARAIARASFMLRWAEMLDSKPHKCSQSEDFGFDLTLTSYLPDCLDTHDSPHGITVIQGLLNE